MIKISEDDKNKLVKDYRDFISKSNLRQSIFFKFLKKYNVSSYRFWRFMFGEGRNKHDKILSDAIYGTMKTLEDGLLKKLKIKIDTGFEKYKKILNKIFYIISSNQLTYLDLEVANHRLSLIKRLHKFDIDGVNKILYKLNTRRDIDNFKYIKYLNFCNDFYFFLRKYLKKVDLDSLKNGYYENGKEK